MKQKTKPSSRTRSVLEDSFWSSVRSAGLVVLLILLSCTAIVFDYIAAPEKPMEATQWDDNKAFETGEPMKWLVILMYGDNRVSLEDDWHIIKAGAYDEVLKQARDLVKDSVDRVQKVWIAKSPIEESVEDWYKDFDKWEQQVADEDERKKELAELERLQLKYSKVPH